MKKVFFLMIIVIIPSCKSNKDEPNEKLISNNTKTEVVGKDIKAIMQGLNNYWDVEASNGTKLVVNLDKIYFIKDNPIATDTTARYFLHVTLENGEKINLDFNYAEHVLKSKSPSKFKGYAIAYRELPVEPIFSILTGQFDEDGRIWQKILHEQNFY